MLIETPKVDRSSGNLNYPTRRIHLSPTLQATPSPRSSVATSAKVVLDDGERKEIEMREGTRGPFKLRESERLGVEVHLELQDDYSDLQRAETRLRWKAHWKANGAALPL
ncbi:MAG: hypothetical protein RJA70_1812 [Pseudomonadota bacterium]|jgi:hypothetical protein